MWIGFSLGEGGDRRHGDRVIAAEDVGHHLGVEQRAHRLLGVGETALGVGVDDVAVAGVDDLHLVGGEVGDLVLEVEHAFGAEAVEHRNLADRSRPKARSDAIARGSVDRHAEDGDVGAVELIPIRAGGLAGEGRQSDEGKVHPVGGVAVSH